MKYGIGNCCYRSYFDEEVLGVRVASVKLIFEQSASKIDEENRFTVVLDRVSH